MNKVIIVGAGITGAFTAYTLSTRGIPVILIDRRDEFPTASHCNPGGLNPFHGPGIPGPMGEFSLRAYHLHRRNWERIEALSRIEFTPRLVDRVILAFSEAEKERLLANRQLYQAAPGFSAEWMSAADLLRMEPRVSERAVGGLFTYGNASVNAERYTCAVMKAAEALGTQRIEGEAIAFSVSGDAITVGLADRRSCTGHRLILATGAWSNLFAPSFVAGVPLIPVKGQLLLAEFSGAPIAFDLTRDTDGIYHAGGARYWLGGTRENDGFDFRTTEAGARSILAKVAELIPSAGSPRVLNHVCGLRPATPDGLPLVGPLPGHSNVYVATGSGAKGMLWSAGIAELCAKFLTDPGCKDTYSHLSIERFSKSDVRGR